MEGSRAEGHRGKAGELAPAGGCVVSVPADAGAEDGTGGSN